MWEIFPKLKGSYDVNIAGKSRKYLPKTFPYSKSVAVLDIVSDMRHYCWQRRRENNKPKQAGLCRGRQTELQTEMFEVMTLGNNGATITGPLRCAISI